MNSKTILKTLCVSSLMAFYACDSGSSSSVSSIPAEEIQADLAKMATVIQSLPDAPETNPMDKMSFDEESSTPILLKISDDLENGLECTNPAENMEVCTSEIGEYYSRDTTYYFAADGTTPISPDELFSGTTVTLIKSHLKDELTEGYMEFRAENTLDFAAFMQMALSGGEPSDDIVSGKGKGHASIYYYNDDLQLDITQLTFNFNIAKFSMQYDIEFMNAKYKTTLKFEETTDMTDFDDEEEAIEEDEPVTVMMKGDIKTHDGQTVGIFQVMTDDSVQILDTDGQPFSGAKAI